MKASHLSMFVLAFLFIISPIFALPLLDSRSPRQPSFGWSGPRVFGVSAIGLLAIYGLAKSGVVTVDTSMCLTGGIAYAAIAILVWFAERYRLRLKAQVEQFEGRYMP